MTYVFSPKACIAHSSATKSDHRHVVLESNMDSMKRAQLFEFTATWIRDDSYEDMVMKHGIHLTLGALHFLFIGKLRELNGFSLDRIRKILSIVILELASF